MFGDLERLCSLCGTSGSEQSVREYIISRIENFCEYCVDALGNIIAFKKGKKTPKNKVMIDAHMDEVALIVTSIEDDGTLTVDMVGGVDPCVCIGRQVLLRGTMPAVVGAQAVHKLSKAQRDKKPKMSELYVDIGAKDKEEAQKYAKPGDIVYFCPNYIEFGENMIMSKAIDDRFGCALLIELIRSELEYDCCFTFTVQEEIGLRGAKTAAFAAAPDFAIVCETTTASDIEGVTGGAQVCKLGEGAVVSFLDNHTMYDRELFDIAFELASEKNIKCQTKIRKAGGNNAGAIHISGRGVRTIAVSAPCRYLHSPSCVANTDDLRACYDMVKALFEKAAVL